ncbi:LETM1 domain-containing protein 1 [Culicoides brevitarsis]|uniref:LETM1 domain-containing protein 1 n=1 Tax=Culicoides brevitarsis TaxID=469753 RepID=UPI00307BB6FC
MSLKIIQNYAKQAVNINRTLIHGAITQHDCRFFASTPKDKVETKISSYSEINEVGRSNVRGYFFGKFFDYVQNYDKIIEKRFPGAMQVYRVFMTGVREFVKDMIRFLKITKIANNSELGLRALNRSEIECYYYLPKDMFKIAPTLLISALPLANYVVFPIAYMYPRTFLTSHFWTEKQKNDFRIAYLRERLIYNKPVFRLLQARLDVLKKTNDTKLEHAKMKSVLDYLGSGTHPSPEEIIRLKTIFTKKPFNLESLTSRHLTYLCYLYSLHTWAGKRGRLSERSYLIHHMDLAIDREGGAHNMNEDSLRHSCFLRGLNPTNLTKEEMTDYLKKWVLVSNEVDGECVSLYLHLPIFLAYNHPNNWKLIH